MKLYYDLHIHSALSPCADNDMTGNNIVNMATLNELDVIAVTDHNSVLNTKVVEDIAKQINPELIILHGMELCTQEEIHVLCLFETSEKALDFGRYVDDYLMDFANNPEKFGDQNILDIEDNVVGKEERLLVLASNISFNDIEVLMEQFDGAFIPAHVDKASYSVFSVLGELPLENLFKTLEVKNKEKKDELVQKYGLEGKKLITNSDAHYLWDIGIRENYVEVEERSAKAVLDWFKK